jgi:hypothetical protein
MGEVFPTTDWSLLSRARAAEHAQAQASFEELLRRYLPAMRRFLIRAKRLRPERADDVVQAFVTERILEGALLQSADRRRGRFRSLLAKALERFLIDAQRRESAEQKHLVPRAAEEELLLEQVVGESGSAFDVEWAASALEEAVTRTYRYFSEREREDLWEVLRSRVVDPAADGTRPPSYQELADRLGYSTAAQAANALLTAKRTFVKILNEVLLEQAGEGADVAEELAELRQILSRKAKTQVSDRSKV